MNFIAGISPLQPTFSQESSRLQSYCSFIKDTFAKGFIKPHEEKLAQKSKHDWSRETWWQRLKKFADRTA